MWNGTACEAFELSKFRSGHGYHEEEGKLHGIRGGQWSPLTHIRCYGLNTAPMFMRFLAFAIQPRSALEIGCGLGTTADFVARFTPGGSMVTCLEPEPMLEEVFGRRSLPWRPTQLAVNLVAPEAQACQSAMLSRSFDLVYSLEVAEHISPTTRSDFVRCVPPSLEFCAACVWVL